MKKYLIILIFMAMVFSVPAAVSAETYTETVVTGLGSGYYMAWGTFSEGMCAFSDGEKYGYVNSDGKVAIDCKLSLVAYGFASSEFSEGVARTVINDKICFIDKSGKTVLATNYSYSANANQYSWSDTMNWGIAAFHEGRACVVGDNGKWGFIDKTGNAITDFLFTIGAKFENGKAYVSYEGGGSNLIDLNGNKLFPRDYGRIDEKEDGSWYCYDLTFHPEIEVGTFFGTAYDTNSYDVYDANCTYIKTVKVDKKYETPDRIDFLRAIHQYGFDQNRYSYAYEVGNGLVLAELKEFDEDGNYRVLIDIATKKELAIPPFVTAEEFNDDGICVIGRRCPENNVSYIKIGAIDMKGNLLVPFNYLGSSWAKKFNNGFLLAQRASDHKLVVVKLAGAKSY
ncbi:WG repeat-containing protein [Anoxybacterium hadale]|uniref:WG repeat-containing protein n=1 Tax=Anoxybacterium hadale TaxID=3408580 RepID=UPI003AFF6E8E